MHHSPPNLFHFSSILFHLDFKCTRSLAGGQVISSASWHSFWVVWSQHLILSFEKIFEFLWPLFQSFMMDSYEYLHFFPPPLRTCLWWWKTSIHYSDFRHKLVHTQHFPLFSVFDFKSPSLGRPEAYFEEVLGKDGWWIKMASPRIKDVVYKLNVNGYIVISLYVFVPDKACGE